MDENIYNIVNALIEAEQDSKDIVATLRHRRATPGFPTIIFVKREFATELGERLSESEMSNLLRGLVRYTQVAGPRRSGGSASPIPPIYKVFAQLYPESEPDITAWIVRNRVNEYDPFGTINCNEATSLAEHATCLKHRKEVAAESIEMDRQRHERAREQIATKATSDLPNAVRRGDTLAVKALLDKGADPVAARSEVGSLLCLARDHNRQAMVDFLVLNGIE